MRKLATLILVAAIALSQVGCGVMARYSTAISPTQAASLDFGPYPANYKEIMGNFLKDWLKDPDSAKVEFLGEPKKATEDGREGGTHPRYGWGGTIRINAKNSYGAYTGYKERDYLIWNGKVIYFQGTLIGSALKQPMPAGGPTRYQGVPANSFRYF